MTALDAGTDPAPSYPLLVSRPRLVLLGGVPGAGKTTLLNQLADDVPGLRRLDPERYREGFAAVLPASVPYRCYRALVHSLAALATLVQVLRGPGRSGAALVVHDPATRVRRRWLTGQLARSRGWDPVLVILDVSSQAARAGQHERGRVVAGRVYARHWRRWQSQRPAMVATHESGLPDGPWSRVYVVSRATAPHVLPQLLPPAVEPLA
jgi:predicted kinase